MKLNSELRAQARETLDGQWGTAVVVTLVYLLVLGVAPEIVPFAGVFISILLLPLTYGMVIIFLKAVRGTEISISPLIDGFRDYGRILGTILLYSVYIVLWSLLLVIPGIVKMYSYAMTNYILLDEPGLKFNGAIEKSMKMMEGKKMQLFLLDLSFIGWALLCLLTIGIGFLWLAPYVHTAHAAFYEDLKGDEKPTDVDAEPEEKEAEIKNVEPAEESTTEYVAEEKEEPAENNEQPKEGNEQA